MCRRGDRGLTIRPACGWQVARLGFELELPDLKPTTTLKGSIENQANTPLPPRKAPRQLTTVGGGEVEDAPAGGIPTHHLSPH